MGSSHRIALEELGRLLSLFAHDLRSPLAALSVNNELLTEEPALTPDGAGALADAKAALAEVERGLAQLGFVASWLEGDVDALDAPPGDLRDVIEEASKRLSFAFPSSCPPGVVVRSARVLGHVLEALLANARDNAPESSVRVDVTVAGERAIVKLVDAGPALSPDASELAFVLEGQARIKSLPRARYGRCAALFASRLAIESIGGSITVGGEDGAAFFQVTIPTAGRIRAAGRTR